MAANETDAERVNRSAITDLGELVPQTYGEAVALWGDTVVCCRSHEWDNRTTWENTRWLLNRLLLLNPPSPHCF
mgnify:CR=1 FL=1